MSCINDNYATSSDVLVVMVETRPDSCYLYPNLERIDRLEVSSPGLDRPLIKAADYRRFAGSEVQIKLRIALGNQRNFSGTLEGMSEIDGACIVRVRSSEMLHEFALENIDRARLVPKF